RAGRVGPGDAPGAGADDAARARDGPAVHLARPRRGAVHRAVRLRPAGGSGPRARGGRAALRGADRRVYAPTPGGRARPRGIPRARVSELMASSPAYAA